MEKNKLLNDNIQWARFIGILLIVFIHSFIPVESQLYPYFYKFQIVFSQIIGRIAVPFLFIISGYLFYYNTDFSFSIYKKKLNNRFQSLIVPYFLWNIIILLFFFSVQESGLFGNYISGNLKRIWDFNLHDWYYYFFVNPIANQFWFIRDLILLNIISIIVVQFIKKIYHIYFILIFILWAFDFNNYFLYVKNEAILFYSLGLFLAAFKLELTAFIIKKRWWLIIIALVYLLLLLYLPSYYPFKNQIHYFLLKLSIILGVLIFWNIVNLISRFINKYIYITNYSFIIFALHIPINMLIVRTFTKLIPLSEITCFILYFIVFIFSVLIPLLMGVFLKKYSFKFYSTLVGNR